MNKPKKILVIDVESTCWEERTLHQFNEIIEIGVCVLDIKTKQLADHLSIIVLNTETEISPFCTRLTTLTQEYIKEHGVTFQTACKLLERQFDSQRSVFASWGDYDRSAFEKNCKYKNVQYPFANNAHLNVKMLFAAKHGYTGGQENCGRDVGVAMQGTAHRGIDDAVNIAKILQTLL